MSNFRETIHFIPVPKDINKQCNIELNAPILCILFHSNIFIADSGHIYRCFHFIKAQYR
jgi:hypothetical protein